jgi:hypothetical protein
MAPLAIANLITPDLPWVDQAVPCSMAAKVMLIHQGTALYKRRSGSKPPFLAGPSPAERSIHLASQFESPADVSHP